MLLFSSSLLFLHQQTLRRFVEPFWRGDYRQYCLYLVSWEAEFEVPSSVLSWPVIATVRICSCGHYFLTKVVTSLGSCLSLEEVPGYYTCTSVELLNLYVYRAYLDLPSMSMTWIYIYCHMVQPQVSLCLQNTGAIIIMNYMYMPI